MVSQQTSSYLQTYVSIFSYVGYCLPISFLCYAMLNINTNRLPRYLLSDTSVKNRHEDR